MQSVNRSTSVYFSELTTNSHFHIDLHFVAMPVLVWVCAGIIFCGIKCIEMWEWNWELVSLACKFGFSVDASRKLPLNCPYTYDSYDVSDNWPNNPTLPDHKIQFFRQIHGMWNELQTRFCKGWNRITVESGQTSVCEAQKQKISSHAQRSHSYSSLDFIPWLFREFNPDISRIPISPPSISGFQGLKINNHCCVIEYEYKWSLLLPLVLLSPLLELSPLQYFLPNSNKNENDSLFSHLGIFRISSPSLFPFAISISWCHIVPYGRV